MAPGAKGVSLSGPLSGGFLAIPGRGLSGERVAGLSSRAARRRGNYGISQGHGLALDLSLDTASRFVTAEGSPE
jgi:hypothetical protein